MSAAAVPGIADGISKARGFFEDFRPEVRTMEINYREKKSRINFQIDVPEGRLKKFKKVKIPLRKGYKIVEMIDDAFVPHSHHWQITDQHYVLDASKLAPAKYRVTIEADVNAAMLSNLVYVRQTLNRDNDADNDDYWLESSIVEPDLLKQIYMSLEVRDVDVGVVVDVEKMFGLTIPSEIKDTLKSATKILDISSTSFDRNQLLRAALSYKKQARKHPLPNPGDFQRIINKVTDRETIIRHINLDRPYGIDSVDNPQKYAGVVPQSFNVQVSTKLTLKSPIAEGHLRFMRKRYMSHLEDEFGKLLMKKKKKLA